VTAQVGKVSYVLEMFSVLVLESVVLWLLVVVGVVFRRGILEGDCADVNGVFSFGIWGFIVVIVVIVFV